MKFKNALFKIVVALLAVAAGAVFVTSFLTTIYYDMHEDVDFPHYVKENIPLLLACMVIVFAAFFLLNQRDFFAKRYKGLITLALCFCVAYCLTLILSIKPLPVTDAMTIDGILKEFAQGDYSSLTEKGGYLFIWPFQLGYIFFGEIVDNIFGHGNYMAWDILLMISILVTVFFLYKITWEIFADRAVCGIMALMSLGMLFFYNYSTFIYGDIYSLLPQTIALYTTILFVKRKKVLYAFGAAIGITLSVIIKTNSEITLIAIVMIVILSAWKNMSDCNYHAYEFPHRLAIRIIISAAMLGLVLLGKNAINTYYCERAGIKSVPTGSPSASHIAMGIQESELENGWYNGYNYKVFADNGYETEKAKEAAVTEIKDRVNVFVNHPGYAFKFFFRKFLTQWADPVCISTHNLDLVSRHVENPTDLMYYIVFGDGNIIISQIMNVFMSVCYLCVFVYLVSVLRKRDVSEQEMLLLILIFGGICFHEFWEGSSRYTMRYYVYWMPYAACGMKMILDFAGRRSKRSK
ncbi:hypothetical protein [Butyrivibrio proteoclasticus]|uniref:hypothetical protein n=1 Tax=Butyrivibrio proteoclasticus TaxID=43305 RepID=UPI00047AAA90|nr:hypothetical protein [Butyrivibrio proteoclasticus]